VGSARRKQKQGAFRFPSGWGGRRERSGPKPKGERAGVSHRERAPLASRFPVHVTMKLRAGLPSLRTARPHSEVLKAFAGVKEREGFLLVHYSVQSNHIHLICEARDRRGLSRGMQALAIRIAKSLNRLWQRAGAIFADRYHDHILRTPREVRNALAYVLNNAAKHGVALPHGELDPCSSGRWFSGWRDRPSEPEATNPVARARTWLLTVGWLRCGRIRPGEVSADP
jgi:REP element-mobilizing transposase RayT